MKTNLTIALLVIALLSEACQPATSTPLLTPAGQAETQAAAAISADQTATAAVEQAETQVAATISAGRIATATAEQVETQVAATISAGRTSTAAVEQAVKLTLTALAPTPTDTPTPSPTLEPTTAIPATETPSPTATRKPIRNLALNQSTTASNSLQSPSNMAVDGDVSTAWGAGDFPPQWIEIDLGAPATITTIRLHVTQHPYGDTLHRILVRNVNGDFSEVFRFEQYTYTGQWLVFTPEKPSEDVQIVRIETLSSPSWVGWLEIQVLGER